MKIIQYVPDNFQKQQKKIVQKLPKVFQCHLLRWCRQSAASCDVLTRKNEVPFYANKTKSHFYKTVCPSTMISNVGFTNHKTLLNVLTDSFLQNNGEETDI